MPDMPIPPRRNDRRAIHRARARRHRQVAIGIAMVALIVTGVVIAYPRIGNDATTASATASTTAAATTAKTATASTTAAATTDAASATTTRATIPVDRPSDRTRLRLVRTITGDIAPKSITSSGTGFVTAQNMMYRHSVTVYSAKSMRLVKTIPDTVRLSALGYPEFKGLFRGAPVEAAFSPDGRYEYVTNYAMYGAGFGPEGSDTCNPSSGYDRSFTYRIDTSTWKIDQAYQVGVVPKVVKATPDGRFVLVSNWCSWDLSVISTTKGREVRRISIGAYPRGIAISPAGDAAYVAVMGGSELVRVDLKTWKTSSIPIGSGPRAIEFSPNDRYIYATLNAEGRVAKLDLRTGSVVEKVTTGDAPRSLAISHDGRALYVVNYKSGSVTKLRTRDMKVVQTITACNQPIGIAYDTPTRRVWVACYGGSILVFNDR